MKGNEKTKTLGNNGNTVNHKTTKTSYYYKIRGPCD